MGRTVLSSILARRPSSTPASISSCVPSSWRLSRDITNFARNQRRAFTSAAAITSRNPSFPLGSRAFTGSSIVPRAGGEDSASSPSSSSHPTVSVWSFNLRSDFNAEVDGDNRWEMRRDGVVAMLRKYNPDIVATQEAIASQVEDLAMGLESDNFDYEGCCRLGGQEDEYCAIFYKKDRFQLVEGDTLWLSENPEEAGSIGWDAMYPRIATWAVFKTKDSGDLITVISTHFDHVGIQARKNSAALLKGLISRLRDSHPKSPVILAGDFNSIKVDNEVYDTLTTGEGALIDAWSDAESKDDSGWKKSTMHKFEGVNFDGCQGDGTVELCAINFDQDDNAPSDGMEHIDWILVASALSGERSLKSVKTKVITDTLPSGRYPSDHFPVGAEFALVLEA
eukprot:CAMPEP_0184491708 /NCGR_PEP_ID=MMETSP0113_2-20130426/21179_1 /TAXON_ID=91329 /ORGANISM="Norrisiella sphaerica, Strain BC52" /LENGTH=394 /DNA_ID=CAMNT_0026876189 /DNA_START=707 /DNA_END=1891 /DNA_ORIENTATION=-